MAPAPPRATTSAGWRWRWSAQPRAGDRSGHLAQPARLHVVDEAADRVLVRDERVGLDPRHALADVGVEVVEGLGGPARLDAGVGVERRAELVVREGEHPAVGVVDQDDLAGAEQTLADRQAAETVLRDHTSRIADHVGVALAEAEQPVGVEARVHARDDGQVLGGWQGEVPLVEALGVAAGVLDQFVSDTHPVLPTGLFRSWHHPRRHVDSSGGRDTDGGRGMVPDEVGTSTPGPWDTGRRNLLSDAPPRCATRRETPP